MFKWVDVVLSLLTLNMYLPKHEQILKTFKRYSVNNNFFKIQYETTITLLVKR